MNTDLCAAFNVLRDLWVVLYSKQSLSNHDYISPEACFCFVSAEYSYQSMSIVIHLFIHSKISIAPLHIHYYSEAPPTPVRSKRTVLKRLDSIECVGKRLR